MRRLSDYSKFDHLDSDDEEDKPLPVPETVPLASKMDLQRDPDTKHFVFRYDGRLIYEFEQTLSEVVMYIPTPATKASEIVCRLLPSKVQIGLRGADRLFLDEATYQAIDTDESTWTFGQQLEVYLQKANKGVVWPSIFQGGVELNPSQLETVRQELMLERFGEENPGFDFRGAEFNGSVPDPRTFMGGVGYE